MANEKHVERLKKGIAAWNKWREGYSGWQRKPDLSETKLKGINLRGANLSRTDLSRADLSEANLSKANLSNAYLIRANLSKANLSKANLSSTNLSGANLSGANLSEADFDNTNFLGANLSIVNLSAANLSTANLSEANFSGADLSRAYLREVNLNRVNFSKTNLSGTNLNGANLHRTNLANAILDDAVLTDVQLWKTQWEGWSIKNIICNSAYWDREGKKPVQYKPHEFEELYSKKTKTNQEEKIHQTIIQKVDQIISQHHCSICGKDKNEVKKFINASGISICEDCLINILDNEGITTRIQRSIVFKPEHKQAGISILSYFSEIIKQKYPHIDVKVKIEQEQSTVRMIVETPEGEIKKVEETLDQYGMVVKGQMLPEQLLSNPLEIIALRQKLDLSALELRHTKELLDTARTYNEENKKRILNLEEQVKYFHKTLGESIRGTKSINLLVKKLLDKYSSNDVVKDSLKLIKKKIDIGIKLSDEKEIKQTLESIKKEDPKILEELSNFTKNSIAGVAGNSLYSWIITTINAWPK